MCALHVLGADAKEFRTAVFPKKDTVSCSETGRPGNRRPQGFNSLKLRKQ